MNTTMEFALGARGMNKIIILFKNGDCLFDGKKCQIPASVDSFKGLLKHISNSLRPQFGAVKKLYSARTGKLVVHLSEIVNGEKYVAAPNEKFKALPDGYRTLEERGPAEARRNVGGIGPGRQLAVNVFRNGGGRTGVGLGSGAGRGCLPARLLLTRRHLNDWDATLAMIAGAVNAYGGEIRGLYTLDGRMLQGPWQLRHNEYYVAVEHNKPFKRMDYLKMQMHMTKENAQKRMSLLRNKTVERKILAKTRCFAWRRPCMPSFGNLQSPQQKKSQSQKSQLQYRLQQLQPLTNSSSSSNRNSCGTDAFEEAFPDRYRRCMIIRVLQNGSSGTSRPARKFVLLPRDLERWDETCQIIGRAMGVRTGTIRGLYTLDGEQVEPYALRNGSFYVAVGWGERFLRRDYCAAYELLRCAEAVLRRRAKQRRRIARAREAAGAGNKTISTVKFGFTGSTGDTKVLPSFAAVHETPPRLQQNSSSGDAGVFEINKITSLKIPSHPLNSRLTSNILDIWDSPSKTTVHNLDSAKTLDEITRDLNQKILETQKKSRKRSISKLSSAKDIQNGPSPSKRRTMMVSSEHILDEGRGISEETFKRMNDAEYARLLMLPDAEIKSQIALVESMVFPFTGEEKWSHISSLYSMDWKDNGNSYFEAMKNHKEYDTDKESMSEGYLRTEKPKPKTENLAEIKILSETVMEEIEPKDLASVVDLQPVSQPEMVSIAIQVQEETDDKHLNIDEVNKSGLRRTANLVEVPLKPTDLRAMTPIFSAIATQNRNTYSRIPGINILPKQEIEPLDFRYMGILVTKSDQLPKPNVEVKRVIDTVKSECRISDTKENTTSRKAKRRTNSSKTQ